MKIYILIVSILLIRCGVIAQEKRVKDPAKAAMYLAFEQHTKDRYVFPIQFFKLHNVKRIVANNVADPDNDFILEFDKSGRWISLGTKGDNVLLSYKNNMPHEFTNRTGKMADFQYAEDTVIVKIGTSEWHYSLVGSLFLKTKYVQGKADSSGKLGISTNQVIIRKVAHSAEVISEPVNLIAQDYLPRLITTYSNTKWELPLSIDSDDLVYKGRTDIGNVSRERYYKDKMGNFIFDNSESGYTTHHVFKMKDDKPLSLATSYKGRQLNGAPEAKPEITTYKYSYFQ
ncbi:hypothetical protein [Pedobacter cryoconitis]|uniref:Uncharacterized protein n=1 Tax=Pedobacter cryoconitis TaxID=188932 RepID=A0A327SR53_9SPHI|nr:hypothetical protein [Pedobacter cryoconitis]RAJ30204.1 hypothetical protein LY11_02545 [Pedobacter cryoconitis]